MDVNKIREIQRQFSQNCWQHFLHSVSITGLRGWNGESVKFQFPVSVIVGENGCGKSTVLKSCASVYRNSDPDVKYFPSKFFVRTKWDLVGNACLTSNIRRGNDVRDFTIKKTRKWSLKTRPERAIYWLDVARTLPLDSTVGYVRIANLALQENASGPLSNEARDNLSYVLGKSYSSARFVTTEVDPNRPVGVLGMSHGEVSQFHQGAGEDATLDLFKTLQGISPNALLIIDEVEASLHPKAQRRLVKTLLELSRAKKIQVILSTHSPYILEELPLEARILLLPPNTVRSGVEVLYEVSSEYAMSRIDDEAHPEVCVYVEDPEAKEWLIAILRRHADGHNILPRITISPVGGCDVVATVGRLSREGKMPYKGISIMDADRFSGQAGCIKFPGSLAPEKVVFQGLKGLTPQWDGVAAAFGTSPGELCECLDDAIRLPDHHDWTKMVGDKLIKSKSSVWEILVRVWAEKCLTPEDLNRTVAAITDVLSVQTPKA